MYYLRSMSIQRADVGAEMSNKDNSKSQESNNNDYEECLSCQ